MKDYNIGGREYPNYQNRYQGSQDGSGYQSSKGKGYNSRRGWNRQNRYQDRNQERFQKDRFRDNSRYEDRSQKQKAYSGSYEYGPSYDSEPYEDIDPDEEYDGEDPDVQYSYNLTPESSGICKKCDVFREKFASNNLFHAHIRVCKVESPKVATSSPSVEISNFSIIEFTAFITVDNELEFRSYRYATV